MKCCTGCRTVISCYREEWIERYGLIKMIWHCPLCRYLQNTFFRQATAAPIDVDGRSTQSAFISSHSSRYRPSKQEMAVSEKEQDNISKINAPERNEDLTKQEASSQKRHQHDSRNAIQRKFRRHKTYWNLLTAIKRTTTILSPQDPTHHITNDNTIS